MEKSPRPRPVRGPIAVELSRRDLLGRASALGLGSLVVAALPVADRILATEQAAAAGPLDDATLQAFADTIIPGRKVGRTELGDSIHPRAIAGVDPEPGAVEADTLRLYKDPRVGVDTLAPAIIADLSTRSARRGGVFLFMTYDQRIAVLKDAFDYGNPDRILYEAAAAVPFTAFCAAALHPVGTDENSCGYRVMGYPGAAPRGYRSFSYKRKLNRGRTKKGSLP